MNISTVMSLLRKDYSMIVRNKMVMAISLLVFAIFVAIYFIIPDSLGGATTFAIYSESDTSALEAYFDSSDADLVKLQSKQELQEAVEKGTYPFGIVIPESVWQDMKAGKNAQIALLVAPATPAEYVNITIDELEYIFGEIAFSLQGNPLNIHVNETVLGPEMLLNELPLRKLMIPMFVVFILLSEMLAIGIALVEEKESRTVTAVLAAPVRAGELLVSKGISGITMLLIQTIVFLMITGSLREQSAIIILTVLAGTFMFIGLAFFIAGLAQDMMSLIAWGVIFLLVFMVPVFGSIFPGMFTDWIRIMPSFIFADTLNRLINLGAVWSDVVSEIGILWILCALFFMAGALVLRRKLKCM